MLMAVSASGHCFAWLAMRAGPVFELSCCTTRPRVRWWRSASVADCIPLFSEEALAIETVRKHGADWLHAPDMSRWFHYNGSRYEVDEKRQIFNVARSVGREVAGLAAKN